MHAAFARSLFATRLFNVTVTNVPGPQLPLYALGARMREVWPLVPLAADHTVGVAIISYDGRLFFGVVADRDVHDVDVLADGLRHALEELAALAIETGRRAGGSPRRERRHRHRAAAGHRTARRRRATGPKRRRARSASLDQDAVDKIVWEMTVAGLRAAVELAELAIEETGFGVFEDKVVKNYVATEFLYDYLKDKPSVGVIETDPQRGIEVVAEPIGVVLALLPITNPTSTALFKSIVAAKTRNAIVFRPSARAARCAGRAIELLQEAGERAGLPPDASKSSPTRRSTSRSTSSTTTGSTSSGRLAARRRLPRPTRRQAVHSVGPGNAPVYVHRSADVEMAVTDILISKTFDASVICPAEQTCVVDEAIADELVAEFERLGARVLSGRGGGAGEAHVRRSGPGAARHPGAVLRQSGAVGRP